MSDSSGSDAMLPTPTTRFPTLASWWPGSPQPDEAQQLDDQQQSANKKDTIDGLPTTRSRLVSGEKGFSFHHVADSGPSPTSWLPSFSLPSLPSALLSTLTSSTSSTGAALGSGFKWGFGGGDQQQGNHKGWCPSSGGDLDIDDVHHPSPGSPLPSHTAFSDKDLVHQTSLSSLTAPSTSFYSAPSSTVREHDSPRGSPSGSMHEGYDSHRARTDEDKRRSRDLRDFRHGQEYGDGSTDRKSGEGAGKLAGEPDGQQKRRPSVLLELPVERRGGEVMEEKTTKQEPKRKSSLLKRVMNSVKPSSSTSSLPTIGSVGSIPSSSTLPGVSPDLNPLASDATRPMSNSLSAGRRTMSYVSSSNGDRRGSVSQKRKYVKLHSKGLKRGTNGLGKIFLAQTIDTNAPVPIRPAPPPPIQTDGPIVASPTSLSFPDAISPPSTPTKQASQISATSSAIKRASSLLRPHRMQRTDSSDTAATATSSTPTTATPTTPTRKSTSGVAPAMQPKKKTSSTGSSSSTTGAGVKGKGKALWCLAWSNDGRYLATAGQDAVVRIYRTLSDEVMRKREEGLEGLGPGLGVGAGEKGTEVCEETPYRVWEGHKDGVLSLSWSKNGFLLTSSMDKTVRLWHPSREKCLTVFSHPDFVTSVTFHPRDDRFFLSGGCDFKLRVWSIVEKKVRHVVEVPEMITAVAFSVDGKTAAAGCFSGKVFFFTDSLSYLRSIKVRSTRGKNSKGKKITNIQFLASSASVKDERVLITSNDSRVRLYRLADSALELKFKGHENESSQIGATMGDDGRWIICGSEDGHVYLWGTDWDTRDTAAEGRYQQFEADSSVVSSAVLAPSSARLLLASSGDALYASQSSNPASYFPMGTLSPVPTRLSIKPTVSRALSAGTLSSPALGAASPEVGPGGLETSLTMDFEETFGGMPILAVATMHGTVKIFRVDNVGNANSNAPYRGSVESLVGGAAARRGSMPSRRGSFVPEARTE